MLTIDSLIDDCDKKNQMRVLCVCVCARVCSTRGAVGAVKKTIGNNLKTSKNWNIQGSWNFYHHSTKLGKLVYSNHRRWLQLNHPYRANMTNFNGRSKRRLAPPIMTRLDQFTPLLKNMNSGNWLTTRKITHVQGQESNERIFMGSTLLEATCTCFFVPTRDL
jgi:hypothetical protein